VILNGWQNFFLTKLVPIFESLGSVMEIIAYIVLFVLLSALIYSCKRSIDHCHAELKHHSHLLHSQAQTVSELNIWMQYFDEKLIKRESTTPHTNGEPRTPSSVEKTHASQANSPEKQEPRTDHLDPASFQSNPVSIYKKTI
jgi:hypothetical protein